MKVKADTDESSPAAMLASQDLAQRCKELGITTLHIKLHATGGNKTKTPGPEIFLHYSFHHVECKKIYSIIFYATKFDKKQNVFE